MAGTIDTAGKPLPPGSQRMRCAPRSLNLLKRHIFEQKHAILNKTPRPTNTGGNGIRVAAYANHGLDDGLKRFWSGRTYSLMQPSMFNLRVPLEAGNEVF